MRPRATLRLQFHRGFTLADALPVVDYAARLGVSHLYASPLTVANPGSMHGYDVVDPTRISPELGGETALVALVERLRARGMGLILDIVPNHMGVGRYNPWWTDVLAHGRRSRYAAFFDIDWSAGKLLLPVLGEPYGEALNEGRLRLVEEDGPLPQVAYYDERFPLSSESQGLLTDPSAFDPATTKGRERLHGLLEHQPYRLAWWQTAADAINWRRFFDVSTLAGLRMEREDVFEAVHGLPFRLYADGLIDGLRVDHVDGLADPRRYCRRLRRRLAMLAPRRPSSLPREPAYLVVEKILASEERLPANWQVDGTTGYDFMNEVAALFHAWAGEAALNAWWSAVARETGVQCAAAFHDEVRAARRQILTENFNAELKRAVGALAALGARSLVTRDLTADSIQRALVELVVHMDVYRTYAGAAGRSVADEAAFRGATERARGAVAPVDRKAFEQLGRWLGGTPLRRTPAGEARRLQRAALTRFQQLTPPVAAKAVEDTAGYRYGRLLSRNEVGADAAEFSLPSARFHEGCRVRLARHPDGMIATATHDHKRGEDVRMRLAVLSEVPERWTEAYQAWRSLNAPHRGPLGGGTTPEPADEYMLYQTLIGAWPPGLRAEDQAALAGYVDRVEAWWRKALREAKQRTHWWAPDSAYEDGCMRFLRGITTGEGGRAFLPALTAFVDAIAVAGAVNGLAQTVLRLTAPGVPDLYQGTEWWDYSLVDPDNRRPVDYAARDAALEREVVGRSLPAWSALIEDWTSGHVKQALVARLLDLRTRSPQLFARGSYLPLRPEGPQASHLVGFWRQYRDERLLVIVPRWPHALLGASAQPRFPAGVWDDCRVCLGDGAGRPLVDALTARPVACPDGVVEVGPLLAGLPVAVCHGER